jgi:hypothetical protein
MMKARIGARMREFLFALFDIFWEKLDDMDDAKTETTELERYRKLGLPYVYFWEIGERLAAQLRSMPQYNPYWRAARELRGLGYIRESNHHWGHFVLTKEGAEAVFRLRRPKRQRRAARLIEKPKRTHTGIE